MDSIVILGDCRVHKVVALKKPLHDEILGGAQLMQSAICAALSKLGVSRDPGIYSYSGRPVNFDLEPSDEVLRWRLSANQAEETLQERFRLFDRIEFGRAAIPRVDDRLIEKLAYGGFAGNVNQSDPKQIAPDVVVIDDLGLQVSSLKFEIPDLCPTANYTELAQFIEATFDKQKDEDLLRAFYDSPENASVFEDLRKHRQKLLATTLQAVLLRLRAVTGELHSTGRAYPAEPVVVISLAGPPPDLSTPLGKNDSGTVWQHLHSDEAQRRRTVVLLNIEDLRNTIAVSSGHSWERTVQDAIIELKRNKKLRPILDFGYVIVRFGLTGAVLVSNDGNDDHTFTLYFNPDQDDMIWTREADGVVLGETALLTASFVEHLTERCSWRHGKPILQDLGHALDRSLLLSVQRLQTHFEIGYGRSVDEFKKTKKNNWFDPIVFSSAGDALEDFGDKNLNLVAVQRMKLPSFRTRHWSILLQSCQADLNNVARNIVKHGPKVVLNTLQDPIDRYVQRLIDDFLFDTRDFDPTYTLFRPFLEHTVDPINADKFLEWLGSNSDSITKEWITTRRQFGPILSTALESISKRLKPGTGYDNPALDRLRADVEMLAKNGKKFDGFLQRIRGVLQRNKQWNEHRAALESGETKFALHLLNGVSDFIEDFELIAITGTYVKSSLTQSGETVVSDFDELIRRAYACLSFNLKRDPGSWGPKVAVDEALEIVDMIRAQELNNPRRRLHHAVCDFIRGTASATSVTPIATPVLRLGKPPESTDAIDKRLMIVDRKEVEAISAVKRMIEQYLSVEEPDRPLSIAVFGPPGAGKSVAVKKIIQMMDRGEVDLKERTINLSQIPSIKSLNEEFDAIAKLKGAMPIVFFDEFDSEFEKVDLGWLKYFLGVMEDGKHESNVVKRAVFVFAGGTSETFEEFSLADRSSSDDQWVAFSKRKGPDFVSRLRGHFNVVGINPSGPDDDLFLIRRALALRFQLAQKQELRDCDEARIDDYMLNAFLHVPKYRHGARSIRMLLDLCANRNDNVISMSSVPPIHQLNMQVDGKSFSDLASGQTKPTRDG